MLVRLLEWALKTKWPPFWRWQFQMYFLEWKVFVFGLNFHLVCILKGQRSALVQVMTWLGTGYKQSLSQRWPSSVVWKIQWTLYYQWLEEVGYDFSIAIQIQWKFHSALTQAVVKWSLWKFAYGTTAVLSWHVQNFVVILYLTKSNNFPSNLISDGKIVREMGHSISVISAIYIACTKPCFINTLEMHWCILSTLLN